MTAYDVPDRRRSLTLLLSLLVVLASAASLVRRAAQARPADSLDWPEDIAVDGHSGDVWLLMNTDTGGSCADRYSASLAFQDSWGVGERGDTIAAGQDGRVAVGVSALEGYPALRRPALAVHAATGSLLARRLLNSAALAHLDLDTQAGDWLALSATTLNASRPLEAQLERLDADGRQLSKETVPADSHALAVGPLAERYLISSRVDTTTLWRLVDGGAPLELRLYSDLATGLTVLPDGRPVYPRYSHSAMPTTGVTCSLSLIDLVGGQDASIPLPDLLSREVAAGPDGSLYIIARRAGVDTSQNWELHRYSNSGEHLGMLSQTEMQHPCAVAPTATAGPSPTKEATPAVTETATSTATAIATESGTATATVSAGQSATPTEESTATPRVEPTATLTATTVAAASATPTEQPTVAPTVLPTATTPPPPTTEEGRIWLPWLVRPR
jgi:hypothetical protein